MQPRTQRGLRRSFDQGARLGVLVTGLVLMVTVIGASEIAGTAPASDASSVAHGTVETEMGAIAGTAVTAPEVDRHLLKAVRVRQQEIREMVFQLSVTPPPAAASDGIPVEPPLLEPSAPPVVLEPPAPPVIAVAPARAPHVVSAEQLRAVLGSVFGNQAETAFAVVMCESAGNASAHTGNGYYGLWQFDLPTWASVGGSGYPSDASVAEQVQRAKMLYDARGWQPWGCHPASRGAAVDSGPSPADPPAS